MLHTQLVTARELERYANTYASRNVVPELVYLLVKQSAPDASECRIPYGEDVDQPGSDGRVVSKEGYREFVPPGESFWEISATWNPQDKATKDFRRRKQSIPEEVRAAASFVFVTPRSGGSRGWDEARQASWRRRRRDSGWKKILVLDGVKLADWLREFPSVGIWMAKKIGKTNTLGGMSTPAEHWDLVKSWRLGDDPPLPPKLFTVGRAEACAALTELFVGNSRRLFLLAESETDVKDFVAAFLEAEDDQVMATRCLYISDETAWRSVVDVQMSHVLVADPRLGLDSHNADLQMLATNRGHSIVIPLLGATPGDNPEFQRLRSPTRLQIEEVLLASKFSRMRAEAMARVGAERISALRRDLQGLGPVPPFATWEAARLLAQALLAGKWDEKNQSDVAAMERLLGKARGEWIESLRASVFRSDAPLIQREGKWWFVARGEAWGALASNLADEELERFQLLAVEVLGERDPALDLAKDQRWAANIHGRQLSYSHLLRQGLAETLALIGSRPEALSACSDRERNLTSVIAVRELLKDADWDRWASLDSLLPLLAEAAPDEFLDSLEADLEDLAGSSFHRVFAEEGGVGIASQTYMSGLLWALEGLAWSPDLLSRVCLVLADLASIDPGGTWGNRPSNSLLHILLPWHIQTTASIEKCIVAVKCVLREQPEVGWKLLLGLLPSRHGWTTGTYKPTWRQFVPRDWRDGTSPSEYQVQVRAYSELAVDRAKGNAERLAALVNRIDELPDRARDSLLGYLSSTSFLKLKEDERAEVWQKLGDLLRRHRRFREAEWSMPDSLLAELTVLAESLAPESPEYQRRHLFSSRHHELFEEVGNYAEQRKRVDAARTEALRSMLDSQGLQSILDFSERVDLPGDVGHALAELGSREIDLSLLPAMLETTEEAAEKLIKGYVWVRFRRQGWRWAETMIENFERQSQIASFLTRLPFDESVWSRVETYLGDEGEVSYWADVPVNPYSASGNLTFPIGKLLKYGRPQEAVDCVARTVEEGEQFDEKMAVDALVSLLASPAAQPQMDARHIVEIITRLQQGSGVGADVLCRLEFAYLPLLDRFSSGSPKTLENRLALEPSFFVEVVAVVYRPRSERGSDKKTDEPHRRIAEAAYGLLRDWRLCPGATTGDDFNEKAFRAWITRMKVVAKEADREEVARIHVGNVLTYAPKDPDGLWIHHAVAEVLNERGGEAFRDGFTTALFNQRGVFTHSAGEEEMKLANLNREKAEALETAGYSRFATAMREFAETYERIAGREAERKFD